MSELEFKPKPTLDWYVGRSVTSVRPSGEEPWQWAIELDGGILIKNENPNEVRAPMELRGRSLQTVILSELDTRLRFDDNTEIRLTPTRYTLVDPAYGETRPQWPDEIPEPAELQRMDEERGADEFQQMLHPPVPPDEDESAARSESQSERGGEEE